MVDIYMSEVIIARTWCRPHMDTMLATTKTMSPQTRTGLYFDPPLFDSSSLPPVGSSGHRAFKKHKVLPHPRNSSSNGKQPIAYTLQPQRHLTINTRVPSSSSSSQTSSPRSLKHQNRRVGGPALPPTPPAAHSRTSSSSQSIQPSSPTCIETPVQSVPSGIPGTPPNQRSPPTPDVTPPRQSQRPKVCRPSLVDRLPSKATTDSRSASFKTARENPDSSEDERSTLRPIVPSVSGRTSQSTVRQTVDAKQKKTQNVGLGLGLDSQESLTPRAKQEFITFDGEWGSGSEVEQEWDDNLNRNVMVRKRRAHPKINGAMGRKEVVEDVTVTPTNATKALRSLLQMHPSPQDSAAANRDKSWNAPSASESSMSSDVRRSSGMSSKSTVSTVVEAILVDATPQQRKTLRHVRGQTALRDPGSDLSPSSSTVNTIGLLNGTIQNPQLRRRRVEDARSESFASTATLNSLTSRKARREVWKNGGIPVVVIPDRKASAKAKKTPSLRSTSSRKSQRSNSMSSVPLSNHAKARDLTPYFDRPSRRSRTMSESDGSLPGDQRTMDYAPMIPMRRSSLSAPTSRNGSVAGSRAGSRSSSLTIESLKVHNTLLERQTKFPSPPKVTVERAPSVEQARANFKPGQLQPTAPSIESSHKDAPDVDHNGDPFFGKRLTTHNTPFSQASVETNGTHSAAEVSEAMAVNIYPHQNKSVLMVDHTNSLQREKSGDSGGTDATEKAGQVDKPNIATTDANAGSITPPQPKYSMDEVDSPLRNPRAPPDPPAIKLTPATPSGLTPATEKMKMLGNYFEENPGRRPSLVKRALSLRKSSGGSGNPGILSRTLSRTRNMRKDTAENAAMDKDKDVASGQYPVANEAPPDKARLHPFWKPSSSSQMNAEDEEDWVYDVPDEVDQIYRYPAIDNRSAPPRRSLSSRMKRTFAILPVESDEHYTVADARGPERRTIGRTRSGSLRVMRPHDSYSSLRWRRTSTDNEEDRPFTAPDRPGHRVWGVEKRTDLEGRRLFPGWQDKMEQYGLHGLQRRLSEHRRQKRTEALRQKISGPREVRDGVGEVIKRNSYKGPSYQAASPLTHHANDMGRARQLSGVERAPMVQAQVEKTKLGPVPL